MSMSLSNFQIAKSYAKKLFDELRSDLQSVVKTGSINGINGAAVSINGASIDSGSMTVDQILTDAVTTSDGPGAVAVTGGIHEITTTGGGANAMTLADGTLGQHLVVVYAAEGAGTETAVLTPTTFLGGTTVTFNAVGDSAHLVYTANGWVFVGGAAVVA